MGSRTQPDVAPTRPSAPVEKLAADVRAGDRRALAKAITLVESTRGDHQERAQRLLETLLPHTGKAARVGISGVPGVGKSTFIEAFGLHLVDDLGKRVAVLAVDPSSARSGGSILGDKTRMPRLSARRRGRSFGRVRAAGSLGGVARRTREAMLVCEAAGYDVVLVETVGVGQSEVAVASMVDCFLVLMLAGAGDELQGIKKGILELADCSRGQQGRRRQRRQGGARRRRVRRRAPAVPPHQPRAGTHRSSPSAVCTASASTASGRSSRSTAASSAHRASSRRSAASSFRRGSGT